MDLTVTPYGGAGTSLLFAISGGNANLPIACAYYIFDAQYSIPAIVLAGTSNFQSTF